MAACGKEAARLGTALLGFCLLQPGSVFGETLPWLVVTGGNAELLDSGAPARAAADLATAAGGSAGAVAIDDSDRSWTVGFGYDTHRFVAVEFAYSDLGRFPLTLPVNGSPIGGEFQARTATAAMLPYTDLGGVRLFGRLGLGYWETETRLAGGVIAAPIEDNGTSPVYGLGADFTLGRYGYRWKARLEWSRHLDVGETATTGRSDVERFSLGLVVEY